MDLQMEFLNMWANVCQPMIEWYVDQVEQVGPKEAFRRWNVKNENYFKENMFREGGTDQERYAWDVFSAATLYVDLLIRWGCFDDAKTA